ncbi:TRIM71 [Mytilus coruscus]|uniref:TRIM71 n=1 Tax=Mytilus coruscus TaxID=42192 RepID=A0A6J8DX97_MYTCO|nr:TRIM71 [Mytilus coruscus]
MASSIRKAQLPLSCQLCDNPNVIKWKCKDCVMLMCDNCKERVHPKSKYSEKHTIISLKDIGKAILDIECTDFTLGSKDEVYYGQYRGSKVKVLLPDDVTNTVLSTSPMLITCIHINKDKEIILGLREQGSPFPVTEFSTRQIAVFDENKKLKFLIEYDQKGKKLFSYIWRISSDSYNNIYAIDQFENFDGRLVALEISGGVKFIYVGQSGVNTSQTPFNPMDVVITRTNIIIITDLNNHSLHALNTKGEMIGLQNVTDLGIKCPGSLCMDTEGFLLIGCTSHIKASYAKIHVAKIAL